jgi:hypothetical protein
MEIIIISCLVYKKHIYRQNGKFLRATVAVAVPAAATGLGTVRTVGCNKLWGEEE